MDSEIHSNASNVDQSDFLPPPPLNEDDSLPLPVVTNVSFDSDDDFPLPPSTRSNGCIQTTPSRSEKEATSSQRENSFALYAHQCDAELECQAGRPQFCEATIARIQRTKQCMPRMTNPKELLLTEYQWIPRLLRVTSPKNR